MSARSERFKALVRLSNSELEKILAASDGPAPGSLAGWEFAGYNRPAWASLLGIRKFVKGFFRVPEGVEGYNIPVRQDGLDASWTHKPSPEAPKRFGFYCVRPVNPNTRDNRHPRATLLDYGASRRNPLLAPERLLRDYLVIPDPAKPDILLGKATLALGPGRVFTNFFILERLRSTAWRPS